MKVVIIHTDFRIYWPARLMALSSYLENKKMELHVVEIAGAGSPYAFAHKEDDNCKHWHILFPDRKMEDLKGGEIKQSVDHILDDLQPEVIIAGAIAFPSGALATAWAKRNKKKIIIFDDSKIDDVPRGKLTTFIKRTIYNCVDAMLYPSDDWDNTGRYWGFDKEQLFYGVDVVDNSFWQKSLDETLICQSPYFLSIGRQIPIKNFLFLIDAYRLYRERVGDSLAYDLVLVGDGPERQAIDALIADKQIKGIKILPFQQQPELIPIYRNAQAFVLSSFRETWGLVINEAMASGLPVIVSNGCGAVNTLVHEGENGFSFSPYHVEELVSCLCTFHQLGNEEKLNLKKNSLDTISIWGVEKFAEEGCRAIEYVIKRKFKQPNWDELFVLKFWKGRYRPI